MNREILWNELITIGAPTRMARMIKLFMNKTRCKVKFNQRLSDEFKVETRLQQGDAISPVFFNVPLETIINETQKKK